MPKRNKRTTGEGNPNSRVEGTDKTVRIDRYESFVEFTSKGDALVPGHVLEPGTSLCGPRHGFDAVVKVDRSLTFLRLDPGSGDTGDGGSDEYCEKFSGD